MKINILIMIVVVKINELWKYRKIWGIEKQFLLDFHDAVEKNNKVTEDDDNAVFPK